MVRTSFCLDKNQLKKGTWTPEEDKKLIDYVTRYGHWNWNLLPRFAGLARSGKSCRLRWLNYLRPNIKRGNYTQEEEETITKMIQQGKRWSAIAAQLPGRTDNEIKNYWHTKLKKKFQHNNSSITHETPQNSKSKDHSHAEPIMLNNKTGPSQSTDYSCSSFESWSEFRSQEVVPDEGEFAFMDAFEEEAIMSRSFWLEPHVADISLYVPSEILVVDETEWFSPVCDVDLWAHD